jgi:hypothetical protein
MAVRSRVSPPTSLAEATKRCRIVVLVVAFTTTLFKLWIAATTEGTNDVEHWKFFTSVVRQLGPIGVYSTHFVYPFSPQYNHPPLVSWLLVVIGKLNTYGIPVRFSIRVPASVADLGTALLVFELVRARSSLRDATLSGVVVALSPVLIIISGFHGNTDPAFVFFTLLSAYLLATHDQPFFAGASAAVAVSIKIVPIPAVIVLGIWALRELRTFLRFSLGFLVLWLPLWGPVIVRQWSGFKSNVLDYKGIAPTKSQWGLTEFARHFNATSLVNQLIGPGRFVAVLVATAVPAVLVWRRRDTLATGVALSLALFLLLTTTFGTQYLAWAAAPAVVLAPLMGTLYNLSAGFLLFCTYNRWNGGLPWDVAHASPLSPSFERFAWLVWGVLLASVALGIARMWNAPTEPARVTTAGTRFPLRASDGDGERMSAAPLAEFARGDPRA